MTLAEGFMKESLELIRPDCGTLAFQGVTKGTLSNICIILIKQCAVIGLVDKGADVCLGLYECTYLLRR